MISTEQIGSVLVVTADNPPVNALGQAVRSGLLGAIELARADASIEAVVIRCAGRTFFAGADITEFGKPPLQPSLNDLIEAIETCAKPVVAAIHGAALGGGLEVALACHYRVATLSARLGLPEVQLGILPGAGGTQRLPRLIGLEAAIPMIVSGEPISAKKALLIGLVDGLADEEGLADAALAFAGEVKDRKPLPRASARSVIGKAEDIDAYAQANARKLQGFDAPQAIFKALHAAVKMPFVEGLAVERSGFETLLAGAQSKALRHYFFAERAASKIAGPSQGAERLAIARVGILGAGTMGGGIAMNFLSAGFPVTLVEREQGPLSKGVALIRKNYERAAERGRLSADQVEQALALLTPTLSYDDLTECDLVIEAVFELMDIKKEVFARLDQIIKPGAILATNTSYLNVDEIANVTGRPEWVVGLHFFSPANIMRLVEVVRGAKTSPLVLASMMALVKRIGKIAVVSGVCHGFIGNRMLGARQRQAAALSEGGARPAEVDQVLLDFGFPMGPFQMSDLAGLDIGWDPRDTAGRTVRERLCEAGLRGQKNGRGYYDYDSERKAKPSPVAEQMIREFAMEHGVPQCAIESQEILERLLFPMVNEGAQILEEGIAQRASDIDVVWVNGYGWPKQTGGPMYWADTIGLDRVVAGLEAHRAGLGADFRLSRLLADKAARAERFNG